MLELLRRTTKDRIVIVSNYTSTLDVVTKLCTECRYPWCARNARFGLEHRYRRRRRCNRNVRNANPE